jgi:ribosomal-protein-alanine N-acetyltransferase
VVKSGGRDARVFLRPPALADSDAFLAANRRSRHLYRGLASPMTTAARFAKYVERSQTDRFVGLLVCRTGDEAIVGCVNLSEIVRGPFQCSYLGYQMFAPFAGQGYMTAAMPLVLRVVFRDLGLHRVEANIQPNNAPSIALVRRAGFSCEGYSPRYLKIAGRWRDHERWALTVETWKARRRK